MYKPIYRSIIKRKEGYFFLICSVFPLLVSLISLFQAGIKSMVGADQISFLEYWELIVRIQWQFGIPTLLLTYLVTTVFRSEIQSRILFLYKDLDKKKIFRAKLVGLTRVLLIYMLLTFIVSVVSYYSLMLKHSYISSNFLPSSSIKLQSAAILILSCLLVYWLVIILVGSLSSRFSTVQAILVGMLFMLLSNVSTELSVGRYLFPTGYTVISMTFYLKIILVMILSGFYSLIFYGIGVRYFKNVEF